MVYSWLGLTWTGKRSCLASHSVSCTTIWPTTWYCGAARGKLGRGLKHKAARTLLDRVLVAREGFRGLGLPGSKWRPWRGFRWRCYKWSGGGLGSKVWGVQRACMDDGVICVPCVFWCSFLSTKSWLACTFMCGPQCPKSTSHLVCCFSVVTSFRLEGHQGWWCWSSCKFGTHWYSINADIFPKFRKVRARKCV